MNLSKIIMLQKDLDEVINKNHPIETMEDRTANKVTALVVELAEFANEARFFKFWSEDREPRVTSKCVHCKGDGKYPTYSSNCWLCKGTGIGTINPLLEEYVDSLHFFVSIAIDMRWEKVLRVPEEWLVNIEELGFRGGLTRAFNGTIFNLMKSQFETKGEFHFQGAWFLFLSIGLVGYGFTEEEIEAAYMEKNAVNHSRQENNY